MNEEHFDQLDIGNDVDGADNDVCDNVDYRSNGFQMRGVRLRNDIIRHLVQMN